MKNLKLFLFILVSLFWLTECEEKESFTTFKISNIQNTGSLDCKFTASAKGNPDLVFYAPCDRYKYGSTIKVQL